MSVDRLAKRIMANVILDKSSQDEIYLMKKGLTFRITWVH